MSNLLEQASLVMIPSGYKEDVVYSEIPIDGSGDLQFTRSSNGTRVNSAGLVEVVPWNLLEYSEDFSNGVWVKTNTTVSTNTTTAPNGTTTADSLLETTANATHQLWQRPAMVADQTFTQSCYIKTNGRNRVQLQIFDSSTLYVGALFDVVSGTIIATNGTSSIESVGNGWYRCIVSGVCPTSTTGYCVVNLATDSFTQASAQDSYTGDASKGVFIWGAQLNIGTTAKPYFPTTDRLNVPRLTYQNGGGGCPSLLLEKQSTNLALYSENFNDAYWGKSAGTTVTANTTISPDGDTNADTIAFAGSSDSINTFISTGISVVSGTTYTISIFTKSTTQVVYFGGATGGTGTNVYNGSVDYGNGWYRQSVTRTWSASGTVSVQIVLTLGSAGSTIAYGFQAELGAYATSYIPTTSSSATRVADECTKTGIGALIGGTSGTVFFDIKTKPVLSSASYKQFCYYFDSASAQSYMYLGSTNLITTNSNWGSLSGATPLVANTRYKIALVYAPNDFALYVNGVSVATASSGTPKDNDRVSIGQLGGGENAEFVFNQYTHFPSRLTNAELSALTTI